MLAGIQLDLFTHLAPGAMTGEEAAKSMGVSEAKLRPLLYALVSAQLLQKKVVSVTVQRPIIIWRKANLVTAQVE